MEMLSLMLQGASRSNAIQGVNSMKPFDLLRQWDQQDEAVLDAEMNRLMEEFGYTSEEAWLAFSTRHSPGEMSLPDE
jgi:hypothetical protein